MSRDERLVACTTAMTSHGAASGHHAGAGRVPLNTKREPSWWADRQASPAGRAEQCRMVKPAWYLPLRAQRLQGSWAFRH